jgi:uncharacterized protein YbjT (DUF2867 family)
VFELAGDGAFTRAELAAEITRQSGKQIAWAPMSEADFTALLVLAGLAEGFAAAIADADAQAARARCSTRAVHSPASPDVRAARWHRRLPRLSPGADPISPHGPADG